MIFAVGKSVPVRSHLGLHRDGYENVRRLSHLDSKKPRSHHTHNCHGNSVHNQLFVQYPGIAAEMPLPIAITQHRLRVRPSGRFIL